MVNFGLLVAEIVSLVWGTPANFNGFRVLAALLQRRRSTEVNQTLHYVLPATAFLNTGVITPPFQSDGTADTKKKGELVAQLDSILDV